MSASCDHVQVAVIAGFVQQGGRSTRTHAMMKGMRDRKGTEQGEACPVKGMGGLGTEGVIGTDKRTVRGSGKVYVATSKSANASIG
jgi:hypothetical protein